jgi:hypothetical protein
VAEVIYMADHKPIPPKQVTGNDGKHRYTVTFDPNAPFHAQWVWQVDYVRTYQYYGSTSTQGSAIKEARKQILAMNKHIIKWEENNT